MAMSARGKAMDGSNASMEGSSEIEQMRCPMCRHTLTWLVGDAPPRRCTACRGWLAAATFRLRQTERDASLRVSARSAQDTIPDADATPSGWKKISRASIFDRFGASAAPFEAPSLEGAEAPHGHREREASERSSLTARSSSSVSPRDPLFDGERREVRFSFEPPPKTDRFRKRREVEASALPASVATMEHADLTEDDAIEAWLDLVESEIEETEVASPEQGSFPTDVSFELSSSDEPGCEPVPRHDMSSFGADDDLEERGGGELAREEIDAIPPGQIIVEEAGATTLLMSEVIEEMRHTELLGSVTEAMPDAIESEEEGEEGHESISKTLMMFGEQPVEERVRVTPGDPGLFQGMEEVGPPDDVEAESGGDETRSDSLSSEEVTEVEEVIGEGVEVAIESPVMDEPVTVIQRAALPPARWRFVRRALGLVGLLSVFCLGLFAGMSWVQMKHSADPNEQALADSPRAVLENMIMLPRERASRNAVGTARTMVGLSLSQDYMSRQKEVARELLDAGELEAALKVLGVVWQEQEKRDLDLGERYAKAALEVGEHKLARQVAVQTYLLTDDSRDANVRQELRTLFNEAIEKDTALHPKMIEIKKDVQVDVIRALGGGKSISLKFKKDGETTHAFKPSQLDWAEGWRAEVASYLFCEAIGCHFKVPKSEPVRISKEDFFELYGRFNSTRQSEYARNFEANLLWVREKGEDGVEREYLHGVLKEWMPGFVDYPIEYTDIWDDWLDATKPDDWARRDLSDALRVLRFRQDGRFFQQIMRERADASTRDVARGLSDVQLFDFVTSNWDRYSGVEMYYGVNNQFDDGEFLSLDNGAAFHILTQRKVEQHFEPVTRFSRSTVAALELLQPGNLDEVLFPSASSEAKQRLEVFWTQRERALKRVEDLVNKHGVVAVLYFD